MSGIKGHGVISEYTPALYVGTDTVDAIYFGEIRVWPSPLFDMDLFFLPDEDDA